MEDVRAVLMDQDAGFVVAVIGVPADMGAPVDDEHAFVPHVRETLGQDAAGKARADDQPVIHDPVTPQA